MATLCPPDPKEPVPSVPPSACPTGPPPLRGPKGGHGCHLKKHIAAVFWKNDEMAKRRDRLIILASRSEARRRLLKQIGLRFRVEQARVHEDRRPSSRASDLVRRNALKKARAVAARHDSGVVIAADTVVRVGRTIIGKPKSIQEAVRTLRILSRQPQWVYTGIAVVDIDHRKEFTAHDKTKIFMCHLNDKQARNYLSKVSPLDKAGSFDIQGLGGVFIERVEGCFYNVVGLPLAKLARLLLKVGIDLF